MARKKKVGFDTMVLTTDFLSDGDVVKIHQNIGASGIVILLSVYLQAFKRQGYYLPVNALTLGIICGESFSTLDQINAAIEKMLDLRIFDREMFEKYRILTSPKLQEMYVSQSKSAKRTVDIAPEHALISINGTASDGKTISDDELKELSRKIVVNWNMLHADEKWEGMLVTEDLITMPEFLETLRTITEKYDGTTNITAWIDLERNAFVEHPHLGLGQIVGHEPTFRMLYNMGEPVEFIPGTYSPPSDLIHPAIKQEARMKRSGFQDEEINQVTSGLLQQQPHPFSKESIMAALEDPEEDGEYDGDPVGDIHDPEEMKEETAAAPDSSSFSNVITTYPDYASVQPVSVPVYVTNESTSAVITQNETEKKEADIPESPAPEPVKPASRFAFLRKKEETGDMDESEERHNEEDPSENGPKSGSLEAEMEEAKRAAERISEKRYVHEYDPELSPLLRDILLLYRKKYREEKYANVEDLLIDEEMFSQEQHALNYLRAYIEQDQRCRDLSFWDTLIDGVIHLLRFRSHHWNPESPRELFDVETICGWGRDSDLEDRLTLMRYHIWYFTDPDRSPDPTARAAGKMFVEMLEAEKEIRERENRKEMAAEDGDNDGEPDADGDSDGDGAGSEYPEGITPDQKKMIDALRSNPEIPEGERGWLEDRILHPEEYKAPDKPYGDRTAPLPWARKHPKPWDELKNEEGFCHEMGHGRSIRMDE